MTGYYSMFDVANKKFAIVPFKNSKKVTTKTINSDGRLYKTDFSLIITFSVATGLLFAAFVWMIVTFYCANTKGT